MRSKTVRIGKLKIGGKNPVAVQSMLNTAPGDFRGAVAQIRKLKSAGCEIFRIAVPDEIGLATFAKIRRQFPALPLVADIHFDAELAVAAAEFADKIRINPGNFPPAKLEKIVAICRKKKIPIRVGVNSGSLEKNIPGKNIAEKLAHSAIRNVRKIEKLGFENLVVSVKSSDARTTIAANRLLAKKISHPLHLGVTESGSPRFGILKSAAALGALLADGIGATIRISLTAPPEREVAVALDLLRILKLRRGVEIVSCPSCGRTEIDLFRIVAAVERGLENCEKPVKIAVMGCVVNGPGEAADADFALVGGRGMCAIYSRGKFLKSIPEKNAVAEFLKIVNRKS